jgi:hypothetical protein
MAGIIGSKENEKSGGKKERKSRSSKQKSYIRVGV